MGSSLWYLVWSGFKAYVFPSLLNHVPWPVAVSSLHVCHGLPVISVGPWALCPSDSFLCRKGHISYCFFLKLYSQILLIWKDIKINMYYSCIFEGPENSVVLRRYTCLKAEPAPLSVSETLSLFWSPLYPEVTAHVLPTSQL